MARRFFTNKGGPGWVVAGLVLLFAGAFLIRVWGLSYFHYWDEMAYLQDAKVICCGKTNYSELQFRPPLLSLLFAAVFLIRNHIYSACIAAAALNALGPVFLFLSGRRIVGWVSAMLASLLLAFGPFFVGVFPAGFESDDTANSLLTDSPALTLVLLALWLMLRALDRQTLTRFAAAGFGVSLAILMRFGSIPAAGFLLLLPLLARQRWSALAAAAAGCMVGMAPYLVWSRWTYGGYLHTLRQGWSNVEGPEPGAAFYLTNLPQIFTWIGVAGLLMAAVASVVGLVRARGADAGRLQVFLWVWLLADFAFFSWMAHKEPRYVMPLAPPLLLLSGWGLSHLCRLRGRLLRPAGALLLAAIFLFELAPSASRFSEKFVVRAHPEEMDASSFLASRFPEAGTLYMNFNYPAFAYFTNFRIHVLPIGGAEVYRAIDDIPEGGIAIAYRANESGEPKIEILNRDANLEVLKEYGTFVIYRRRGPSD